MVFRMESGKLKRELLHGVRPERGMLKAVWDYEAADELV